MSARPPNIASAPRIRGAVIVSLKRTAAQAMPATKTATRAKSSPYESGAIGYMTPAAFAATLRPQQASALRHLEGSAPMPVATVAPTRNSQPRIPVTPG